MISSSSHTVVSWWIAAMTRREIELLLSEGELTTGGLTGQASWISKGLKIEETQ